jgi:preprotein translocase subunit SecA
VNGGRAQPRTQGRPPQARQQQARQAQAPAQDRAAQDDAAEDAVPAAFAPRGLAQPKRPTRLNYSAPSEDGSGQSVQSTGSGKAVDFSKVGRNEPCPCGSGKKFKVCHGDPRNR